MSTCSGFRVPGAYRLLGLSEITIIRCRDGATSSRYLTGYMLAYLAYIPLFPNIQSPFLIMLPESQPSLMLPLVHGCGIGANPQNHASLAASAHLTIDKGFRLTPSLTQRSAFRTLLNT